MEEKGKSPREDRTVVEKLYQLVNYLENHNGHIPNQRLNNVINDPRFWDRILTLVIKYSRTE